MSVLSAEHVPTMKLINYLNKKTIIYIEWIYNYYIHHIRLVHVLRDDTKRKTKQIKYCQIFFFFLSRSIYLSGLFSLSLFLRYDADHHHLFLFAFGCTLIDCDECLLEYISGAEYECTTQSNKI